MESKEQTTKLRMLYLAKILYEETDAEHYYTTTQLINLLKERYGIDTHRATIPTDISALRAIGMQIEEYLGTQKRFWIENRTLTVPEVKLLMDAVNSAKFIPKTQSEDLEKKLLKLVNNYEAAGLVRNISVEHRVKRDNEHIYAIIDIINRVINENRKISFCYFKYDVKKRQQLRNGGEPYVFSPRQLVWNGEYYYVVGVNDAKEVRIFRLDRMADAPKILDEKAKGYPKGFSFPRFLNTTFRMFGTDYTTVTLLCANDVVDSILDRFGRSTKLTPVDDSHFRIKVDVAISNVFYSWVFGFSGKVRIEGPENVKTAYMDMVKAATECC